EDLVDRATEVVVPRTRRIGQATLQRHPVELTDHVPALGAYDIVQPRQDGLGHARGVVDRRVAPDRGGQDALEPVAYLRHVPVAWQVDQTGQEAAVVVAPEEQPELATLLQVEYGARDRHEVVERRLEQLVAWVGLEE